jgi:hypothetical protein
MLDHFLDLTYRTLLKIKNNNFGLVTRHIFYNYIITKEDGLRRVFN